MNTIMSKIFMPGAWGFGALKSNEIDWDRVFAEHDTSEARRTRCTSFCLRSLIQLRLVNGRMAEKRGHGLVSLARLLWDPDLTQKNRHACRHFSIRQPRSETVPMG